MVKIFLLFSLLLELTLFAKPNIVVSILPQKTFVDKIAQGLVEVTVMVPPGSSPHNYEPKVSQMIALSKSDIYFSIGIEFERVWLARFKSQNPELNFIDMSRGIKKIASLHHHHDHEDDKSHKEDEHHEEEQSDPHTWTAPSNVKIMAQTIFETLIKLDPKNASSYEQNLHNFLKEITQTDTAIQTVLKPLKPKTAFMVFHPSWGYFAKEYNLEQIAVEVEGKSPKPKEIIAIIKEAKDENVQVIFTQPEFSDKSAKVIAQESKIAVKKISPLNPKWSQNLIFMAESIAKK